MLLWIVKLVIVILLGMSLYKAARAKKADDTIEFKMNVRSWIEFSLVLVLDIFILISFPGEEKLITYVFMGQIMMVLTFLHTKRFVFVGRNYLYMLEHVFPIDDVSNVSYKKGVLHLDIRNTGTKVRLPVGDVEYLLERFSGKKFQK